MFLSAAFHSLYSSSEKGYTNAISPVTSVGSTVSLGLHDMVFRSLMSSWCATWLELTIHGGVEVVGSLARFLIACHAL